MLSTKGICSEGIGESLEVGTEFPGNVIELKTLWQLN